MRRTKTDQVSDTLTFILVNEMRQLEEAAERVRLVVKAIGERAGVRYELPRD